MGATVTEALRPVEETLQHIEKTDVF